MSRRKQSVHRRFSFCFLGPFDSPRVNRSAVTSPNLAPLPLRSINHRVFHFFMRARESPKGIQRVFEQFQFQLFYRQKRTKQNERQVYRNTQKQCGEEAQTETIKLRSSPFCSFSIEQVSWFWVGGWGEKKNNHRKSENTRPETPASLQWSLKTTRHGHQIDTNSIQRKM